MDDADARLLDQALRAHQRALIASLWPAPTRQCVAAPVYLQLPAPAVFGVALRVDWPGVPAPRVSPSFGRSPPEAPSALAA